MRPIVTAVLSLVLTLSTGPSSAQTYTLVKTSETPLIMEDDIIGNIADMTRDENGHFFLADDRQHTVWVADPSGTVIQRLGSEGAGPGELSRPRNVSVDGDRVIVWDSGNNRITVFSTAGIHETDFRVNLYAPVGMAVGPEGHIAVSTVRDKPRLTVYDSNGTVIREIDAEEDSGRLIRPMRINFNHMTGLPDGEMLYSPVNRYEVYRIDWDGTILKTYRAQPTGYSPIPTTPPQGGRRRVTPLFRPLLVDDHVFVQRSGITDDDEFKRFGDLFTLDGDLVQTGIELPMVFHYSIGEDLYGIDTTPVDAGEDNPHIVIYRLDRGP